MKAGTPLYLPAALDPLAGVSGFPIAPSSSPTAVGALWTGSPASYRLRADLGWFCLGPHSQTLPYWLP